MREVSTLFAKVSRERKSGLGPSIESKEPSCLAPARDVTSFPTGLQLRPTEFTVHGDLGAETAVAQVPGGQREPTGATLLRRAEHGEKPAGWGRRLHRRFRAPAHDRGCRASGGWLACIAYAKPAQVRSVGLAPVARSR